MEKTSKKYLISILIGFVIFMLFYAIKTNNFRLTSEKRNSSEHLYVTWDNMEFDKCVSAWLITRFLDKEAEFKFQPKSTVITNGIPFDVPGAKWSRQHRKCTSECVLEQIKEPDKAMKEIVKIAKQIELNYWQIEHFPVANKHLQNVKKLLSKANTSNECFEFTYVYFDDLYEKFNVN